MNNALENKFLRTHLLLLHMQDIYRKEVKDKLHIFCGTMYYGKPIRKRTYWNMIDIQPIIKDKKLTLKIYI